MDKGIAAKGRDKYAVGDKVDRLSFYEESPRGGTIRRRAYGPYEDYLVVWPNGGETWESAEDLALSSRSEVNP